LISGNFGIESVASQSKPDLRPEQIDWIESAAARVGKRAMKMTRNFIVGDSIFLMIVFTWVLGTFSV
jgi:hypothetical protein